MLPCPISTSRVRSLPRRGHSTPSGTGLLSPYAQDVPGRGLRTPTCRMSPQTGEEGRDVDRAERRPHNGGEPPGCNRMTPLARERPSRTTCRGHPQGHRRPGPGERLRLTRRSPSGPLPCPCELFCVVLSAWIRPPSPSQLLPPRQGHRCSGGRCRREASSIMPTGASTHPAFPQHEDPAASQPSLWTPAPSVLAPRHSVLGTWLRPGTFHAARCAPLRAGTIDAVGDRIPVPLRAGCPRPEDCAPLREKSPRQECVIRRPALAAPRCARRVCSPTAAAPGARARGGSAQWCW